MTVITQATQPAVDTTVTKQQTAWLAKTYYPNDSRIRAAAETLSPEFFLRLFITAHGMSPVGRWKSHTYVNQVDSVTGKCHFFLIPIPVQSKNKQPWIRFEESKLKIDDIVTTIVPQNIPHTTPFWYFHYNPNREHLPYYSMTLNLSPSCGERCVLCAGAKTGRVNNGMQDTLAPESVINTIMQQHPEAKEQLDLVAIVTGCFHNFDALKTHLTDVRRALDKRCSPAHYRVLEHNVETEAQLQAIVAELGFDVWITLECYDQELRNIALNGKVGRKGRDSKAFLAMIEQYARFIDARPELGKRWVKVTYLAGLDSLEVTEYFFQQLANVNKTLKHVTIVPWLSIFTAYNEAMRVIQRPEFGLRFLLDMMDLCHKYFDADLLMNESGGTGDGYARGLF